MERHVRFAYPAAFLILFVVGFMIDVSVWQAALLGIAGMVPVILVDLFILRSKKRASN